MVKTIILTLSLLCASLSYHGHVWGAEPPPPPEEDADVPLLSQEEMLQLSGSATLKEPASTVISSLLSLGYQSVMNSDNGYHAFPYADLKSGMTADGSLSLQSAEFSGSFLGTFRSERDYHVDLTAERGADYRFQAEAASFRHNLPTLVYDWSPFPLFTYGTVTPVQSDSSRQYGVTLRQQQGSFRLKPFTYPFHLFLEGRRYQKEGVTQLRFADILLDTEPKTLTTRSRLINREVTEGTLGIDAHIGYFDLANTFQVRDSSDNQGIPRDSYLAHSDPFSGASLSSGGMLQHNEEPDSLFWMNTARIHTSISGGLVGALSWSYGKRESRSKVVDITNTSEPETIIQNISADLSYTPLPTFSASAKFRRESVENHAPLSVTRLNGGADTVSGDQIATPLPVDYTRTSLITSLMYRPVSTLTAKVEYRGDFLARKGVRNDGVDPWLFVYAGSLRQTEERHKGILSLISRPVQAVRLKGQYSITDVNHPLYGTTPDMRYEGELQALYTRPDGAGGALTFRDQRDVADDRSTLPQQGFHRNQQSLTLAGHLVLPSLRINASCAYLRNSSDRDTLIGTETGTAAVPSEYLSLVRIFAIDAAYQLSPQVALSAGYQQVRGTGTYSPDPATITIDSTTTGTTDGLSDLSSVRTVEHDLSAKISVKLSERINTALDYRYKVLNDQDSPQDASAHLIMAQIGMTW